MRRRYPDSFEATWKRILERRVHTWKIEQRVEMADTSSTKNCPKQSKLDSREALERIDDSRTRVTSFESYSVTVEEIRSGTSQDIVSNRLEELLPDKWKGAHPGTGRVYRKEERRDNAQPYAEQAARRRATRKLASKQ